MGKINYVIYDLETGGLSKDENGIAEVAMIALDGETLEEIGRYETFVQPYLNKTYTAKAREINGITETMMKSGKEAKLVVKEMTAFLKELGTARNKKPITCGHNIIDFDNPYTQIFFTEHKKDFEKIISKQVIDTMWFSRMRNPFDEDEYGKHALPPACAREGIELVDGHRAMKDVESNAELVKVYLKLLRGEGSAVEKKEEVFRKQFKF